VDYADLPYTIEPMQLEDIDVVIEIERVSFPSPWSAYAYQCELLYNAIAHYFVARWQGEGLEHSPEAKGLAVLGYGGFRLMAGEAHICTLAVRPSWRGLGIGELLLATMLDKAVELGAAVATLEVRISNTMAQNLYHKYGFEIVGLRRHYYIDRDEDALVMSTERLASAAFQSHFQALKQALRKKLMQNLNKIPRCKQRLRR